LSGLLLLVASIAWVLLPLVAAVFHALVCGERWTVQESHHVLYWMAAVGVAWAAPLIRMRATELGGELVGKKWQVTAGLVVWTVCAGLMGGRLACEAVNCAFDRSPGEEVTITVVKRVQHSVRFRVASGEQAGLTFIAGNGIRLPPTVFLHRGRLGLYYCRYRGTSAPTPSPTSSTVTS